MNSDNWNGPYVDTATRLTKEGQFDISNIFPESHVELVIQTIDETAYQVVLLKGIAETQLKNAILAKCGDCQPLPGRDDIGLLVQQVGVIPKSDKGFETDTIAALKLSSVTPPSPWVGPTTNLSSMIATTPQMPSVPTAPATSPPSIIKPSPNPSVPTTNPTPPSPSPDLPINYAPPTATPEEQTLGCPSGWSGTKTQIRNKIYDRGVTTYTPWIISNNTCEPPPPPPPIYNPPPSGGTCRCVGGFDGEGYCTWVSCS